MSQTTSIAQTISVARTVSIAFLFFLVLTSTAQPQAETQATIKALARGLEPLEETADIRLTRFADFTDEPAVRVGMTLEPGDLLASGPGDIALELECEGGSLLRFTGSFRVLVDVPGDGVDCAVNFLSGTVDVLTDQPTEVQAGGVVLGSEGTQYTVELARLAQKPDLKCEVYDGRVEWRFSKKNAEWLSAGKSIRVADQKADVTRITATQLTRTSERYARFDIVNARAMGKKFTDEKTASRDLAKAHEMVLVQPKDTQRRVNLAKTQLRYSLPKQAQYNLRAGGVRTEEELKFHRVDGVQLRQFMALQTPWTLVGQKKFKQAIEAGKKKMEAGSATSRDYYALALAFRELEGRKSPKAAGYANRAISRHKKDKQLSDRELRDCKNIGRGG